MDSEFWKIESCWVLLRVGEGDDLLPYNIETRRIMVVDDDGAPEVTVPAMLRDGVPVIDRDDPRFTRA